jgi:hypothetical protein
MYLAAGSRKFDAIRAHQVTARQHGAPLCLSSQSGNGTTPLNMKIVSIDEKVINSLVADLGALADEAENLSKTKDYYLQDWLDNQEVCEILNVSKRTLQTYRDNGKLPFTQIDRKMYYKPADIEALLNSVKRNK